MNALFDLKNGVYTDLMVQKEHEKNECKALCQMADCSSVSGKVILLADRNYKSCNNLAHLERKGWKYLIRIRGRNRAVAYSVKLPNRSEFDIPVHITLGQLTVRQLEARGLAVPESFYRLPSNTVLDFLEPGSPQFYELILPDHPPETGWRHRHRLPQKSGAGRVPARRADIVLFQTLGYRDLLPQPEICRWPQLLQQEPHILKPKTESICMTLENVMVAVLFPTETQAYGTVSEIEK